MSQRTVAKALVALFFLMATLLGCIPLPTTQPASSDPLLTPSMAKDEGRLRPGRPSPGAQATDFTLNDLEGNAVSLRDFRGKAVMINFWASWCAPCRYEIPHMARLYDELHGQGFEILAINLNESSATVAKFVQEFNIPFPVLLDSNGAVATAYYVRGIPTSVFVDAEGIIRYVHIGALTEERLGQYVAGLMSDSKIPSE